MSREKRFIKEIRNLPNEEYVAILPFRKNVFKKNILPGKKKTWIISDRVNAAGDNGEALFEFLCKNPIKNINVYFVINKNSPDWNRLKKLGPVVDSGSVKHKNLLTKADLIISSHIEDAFFNPFGCSFDLLKGLMKYKFVFLQHGITKDDLSSWLNRFNKNISLFVTSAEREKQSIVNNSAYYYSEDIVKRLGFPRHDKLLTRSSNSSKRILIAPTWRTGLVTPTNPATGLKRPRDDFEKSDFFSFYSSLLNNNKLRKAAVNLGYAIDFFIHPCMIQEVTKFKSDFVNILTQGDYSTLLKTSAIMLTDYSSVAFDFAILKKPIVYTQFDRDTFFDSQIYNQGYFNYDTDAFGPICLTVEETVDKLIYYMKNPVLESKYLERINDFFIFPIEGSNKRIVDALLSL